MMVQDDMRYYAEGKLCRLLFKMTELKKIIDKYENKQNSSSKITSNRKRERKDDL